MDYSSVKWLHISCAFISFCLFFLRGLWLIWQPAKLRLGWVRVIPHVVDTVLLLSAISMVMMSRQYPFVEPWLTAKVLALLLYILLGMLALKWGKTLPIQISAWVAGLLVFVYIVLVALARSAIPL